MNLDFNKDILHLINKFRIKKIFIYIFFFTIFIIGLNSFKDYGVYGDEPFHRWIGSIYYLHYKDLITNFNINNEHISEIIRLSEDEYFRFWVVYPVFFDLFTELISDIFNVKTTQGIFQTRHLINFLIFFISTIFFYKLINLRFKNFYFSILGVIFLFFSPKIFAESFYNSKDILFMSFSIIKIYFSFKFIKSQNLKNLIFYSISSGLLIQSRIMGLIFPLFTFTIILFEIIESNKEFKKKLTKIIISTILIFIIIILFWPFVWVDFFKHFNFYLQFLSHLAGPYVNLYFGENFLSNNSPWHFKFIWILITIPSHIILLSVLGFVLVFFKYFNRILTLEKNNKIWFNNLEGLDFLIFLLLFIPLVLMAFYKNNFDGWRHFYYVYPFIIYLAIIGLEKIKKINFSFFLVLNFLMIANIFFNLNWMIKHHPYQYTYFNLIHKKIIKKNFDLDYMGLSIKNSLEYILENDKRDLIKVSSLGQTWIEGNTLILHEKYKKRLEVANYNESDYIIDTFRPVVGKKMQVDLKKFSKFYDLSVDGKVVNSIYKKKD